MSPLPMTSVLLVLGLLGSDWKSYHWPPRSQSLGLDGNYISFVGSRHSPLGRPVNFFKLKEQSLALAV